MAKLYVLFNFENLKFKLMTGEDNLVLYKTSSSLYWVSFFFNTLNWIPERFCRKKMKLVMKYCFLLSFVSSTP